MNGTPVQALRRGPLLLDTGMVLLLTLLSLVLGRSFLLVNGAANPKLIFAFGSVDSWRAHVLWWWATTAVGLGALLARRRFPVAAFLVTGGMALAHATQPGFPRLPVDLAAPIALYTVASHVSRRGVSATLLVVALGSAYAMAVLPASLLPRKPLVWDWSRGTDSALMPLLTLAAAWFAGDSTRARRAYLARVERERDQQAQLNASWEFMPHG
jgi:hypothetical protein